MFIPGSLVTLLMRGGPPTQGRRLRGYQSVSRFTLVELRALIAIIGMQVILLLPAAEATRAAKAVSTVLAHGRPWPELHASHQVIAPDIN